MIGENWVYNLTLRDFAGKNPDPEPRMPPLKRTYDGIMFLDEPHLYYARDRQKVYISGTQFIGLFKPKFDSNFWSIYKGAERLLADGFKTFKDEYLNTGDKEVFVAKMQKILGDNMYVAQQEILAEWEEKKNKSLEKGTDFHNREENKLRLKKQFWEHWDNKHIYKGSVPKGIHPEMRLYDHNVRIAGSADRVTIYENGNVDVLDFKTSKSIEYTSYYNRATGKRESMLDPISHLPDCNYVHYSLQLSLYGWILEQHGYKVRRLTIKHIDVENKQHFNHYVPYAKKAVESMIQYYIDNYRDEQERKLNKRYHEYRREKKKNQSR